MFSYQRRLQIDYNALTIPDQFVFLEKLELVIQQKSPARNQGKFATVYKEGRVSEEDKISRRGSEPI
jgi:hypothetical protein